MKKGFLILLAVLLLQLTGCGSNWMGFMASDESDEACKYDVSVNLDSKLYDSVLDSSCADDMQKGAAYFGKAGYDINDVINNFVEASTAEQSGDPLSIYMKSLVGDVTSDSLSNMTKAKKSYAAAVASEEFTENQKKDSEFYTALVSTVKSLSLLKVLLYSDGQLLSNCDINGNSSSDDADSVACALVATAASGTCSGGAYTTTGAMTLKTKSGGAVTGIYNGVDVSLNGTATASCPAAFKKIRAQSTSGAYYYLSTSTSEKCDGTLSSNSQSAGEWPCPIMDDSGNPLGLAEAVQTGLGEATTALAMSMGASSNDVNTAITAINSGACGSDAVCSETEIASYVLQMQK